MKKINLKENLLAIGIALILSGIVFFAIQNSSLLTADIAGTQADFTTDSDLISYVEGDKLIVAATKSFPDVETISMLVFFDPETAKIERDAVNSRFELSYTPASEGRASITLSGELDRIGKEDRLVTMGVIGEVRDVTVSDIVISFVDGSTDRLSLAVK